MKRRNGSPLLDLHKHFTEQTTDAREAQRLTANAAVKLIETNKAQPEDISIMDAWDVCVAPLIEASGKDFDHRYGDYEMVREEVSSSSFPYLTNQLIHPLLIRAYEEDIEPMLQLVTEVDSNHREETIAGTTDAQSARWVEEGMPYPDIEPREKRVQIKNHKFGHGLALTEEMIRFDQTGELQRRAQRAGSMTADVLEEFIAYRIDDTAWPVLNEGTSQSFIIDGTRRAMYADDHSSWDDVTNDNSYNGGGSITAAEVKGMVNLLKGQTDRNGTPVRVRPNTVYSHTQREEDLVQLFQFQDFEVSDANRDRNMYKGRYNIVTSQFAPDTAAWYIGDFARQFRLQWVWRPRTNVNTAGDPKRDIVVAYYSSFFAGVGAEDYRFVCYNDGTA